MSTFANLRHLWLLDATFVVPKCTLDTLPPHQTPSFSIDNARMCVLQSSPVATFNDMAAEEESDETNTDDDYNLGKSLSLVSTPNLVLFRVANH